jgi:DNA-directed RNA polymerase subunit RPC12/RpoP
MSCPFCSGRIFISKEEPRVQTGCPNCLSKVMPIGVSEEEFIRQILDNEKESKRQMSLPLNDIAEKV